MDEGDDHLHAINTDDLDTRNNGSSVLPIKDGWMAPDVKIYNFDPHFFVSIIILILMISLPHLVIVTQLFIYKSLGSKCSPIED